MPRAELTVNDLPNLESRIKDKSAEIGIVGLGYVGLPLTLAFGEAGFTVTGIDSDKGRVNTIIRDVCYLPDIESARLVKQPFSRTYLSGCRLSTRPARETAFSYYR
jgi:UDP-N-acetyl-D-mannosaminuronate dehydrogenase